MFNVNDYDAECAIPGRYEKITRTAECQNNMSHCSKGRFRETSIIESDDIQNIASEIDIVMYFFKKVQLLVDSVKKKYRYKYQHDILEEMAALPAPLRFRRKPLPPMASTTPPASYRQ